VPGTGRFGFGLAACDGADDSDLRRRGELAVEAAAVADVRAVDVDVHERPELAALVEEQVAHRQRAQRVGDGRGVDLETVSAAGLGGEQRRQPDYGDLPTSTDSTGGSCDAASLQPPLRVDRANTEPLCVPR
jgi:hypothetical protein